MPLDTPHEKNIKMESFNNGTNRTEVRFVNKATAAYIGIILAIGLIGNGIVLYIYGVRFKLSPFNIFIIFLAVVDILFCLVNMPLEIAYMVHPVEFEGCKAVSTIAMITSISTGQALVAVAALRFRAVCRPLKPTLSNKVAKYLTFTFFATALLVSWPHAVLLSNVHMPIGEGVFVVNCASGLEYEDTIWPLLYNIFQFVVFVGAFIAIIVLYYLTGLRLWKREKYGISTFSKKKLSRSIGSETEAKTPSHPTVLQHTESCDTVYSMCDSKSRESKSVYRTPSIDSLKEGDAFGITNANHTGISQCVDTPKIRKCVDRNISVSCQMDSKASNKLTPVKMLIIMTLIFFLSYVPHLSLRVYLIAQTLELTPVLESIIGICVRSYMISSVCNPILYGCYNRKFREEIKVMFSSKTHTGRK